LAIAAAHQTARGVTHAQAAYDAHALSDPATTQDTDAQRAQRRAFVRERRTAVFGYPRRGHGPSMSIVYGLPAGLLRRRGRRRPEHRVVLRLRPYASFQTPPRHVHEPEDLKGLTHWVSTNLPW
jgi:hypothetical protein